MSGNRLLVADVGAPIRTKASAIYRPRSAQEIADLVRSLPAGTKVLVVTVVFYDSFRGGMADFVGPGA